MRLKTQLGRLIKLLFNFTVYFIYTCQSANARTSEPQMQRNIRVVQSQAFSEVLQAAANYGVEIYLVGSSLMNLITFGSKASFIRLSDLLPLGSDIDLLVSGSRSSTENLKVWLKENVAEFNWDVGNKNQFSRDLVDQHTDSISTLALKLSAHPEQSQLIDLLNPSLNEKEIIARLAQNRLEYLFSEHHARSYLFMKNKNPPIFSALRFFANSARFNLDSDSLKTVDQVLENFDYSFEINTAFLQKRFERLYFRALEFVEQDETSQGEEFRKRLSNLKLPRALICKGAFIGLRQ